MRIFYSIILLLIVSTYAVPAQDVQQLPVDPRVTKGTLANGLTYYLIDSKENKGVADFYLIQKGGAAIEDPAEAGISGMITNLGFRGTRNFPGATILDYLSRFGLYYGEKLGVEINPHNTMYRMKDVDIKRSPNVVDSCLLILYNWGGTINIDDEDLEVEQYHYSNILLKEIDSDTRIDRAFKRELLKGTPYPYATKVDAFYNLDKFSTREIRRFYYRWFRPDLQAVIIAGDIDRGAIESKIKSLFQASPKPLNPHPLKEIEIENNEGVVISVAQDAEATSAKLSIWFKSEPLPANLNNSAVPFLMEYMYYILSSNLEVRLMRAFNESSIPVFSQYAGYTKYMDTKEKEAYCIKIECAPEDVYRVMAKVSEELDKIRIYGLFEKEIEYAGSKYLSGLEYGYNYRFPIKRDAYTQMCLENFLNNSALASIELKWEMMREMTSIVNRNNINLFARSVTRKDENVVVTLSLPKEVELPEKEALMEFYNKTYVGEAPVERQVYDSLFRFSPEDTGEILTDVTQPLNSQVWALSNGATVVFQPGKIEPERVKIRVIGKGGFSLMRGNDVVNGIFINEIIDAAGFGGVGRDAIDELCRDKGIIYKGCFTLSEDGMEGECQGRDIELFMQMINKSFTEFELNRDAFDLYKKKKRGELKYRSNNPVNVADDNLELMLHNNSRFSLVQSPDMIDKLSYERSVSFVKNRFANAANFCFIIVGDLNPAELKEYVKKYIGTIPGNPNNKDSWQVVPYYLTKRDSYNTIETDMGQYRSIQDIALIAPSPFDVDSRALSDMAFCVLKYYVERTMFRNGLNVGVSRRMKIFPEEYMIIYIRGVAGEGDDQVGTVLYELAEEIIRDGIDVKIFDMILKNYLRDFRASKEKDNNFWLDMIHNRFLYGKDMVTKYELALENLLSGEVEREIINILEKGHRVELLTTPSLE